MGSVALSACLLPFVGERLYGPAVLGLTPGYWGNWDNHYSEDQFLLLLQGTIGEGETLDTVNYWLSSVGCDGADAVHCMRRFLLANQLTLSLTQKAAAHPDLFVPTEDGRPATLFRACQVPGVEGNLGVGRRCKVAQFHAVVTVSGETHVVAN